MCPKADRRLVLLILLRLVVVCLHAISALGGWGSIAALVELTHFLNVCIRESRREDAACQRRRIGSLRSIVLLTCVACVSRLILLAHFLRVCSGKTGRENRIDAGTVRLLVRRLSRNVASRLVHDGLQCLVLSIALLLLTISLLLVVALCLRSLIAVVQLSDLLCVCTREAWRENGLSLADTAARRHAVCRSPDRLGMSTVIPVLYLLNVCSGVPWLKHSPCWSHRSEKLLLSRLHLILVVCVGHG